MKKSTQSEMKFGKFLTIEFAIFTIMFLFSNTLHAQDVLLGQYEFTTGVNQLKSTNVATGIAMGDVIVGTGSAPVTATFNGDALELSNFITGMGIGSGKCVNIPVTKLVNASEFNIARIDITLKRATANKIQINFGNEINTFDYRTYASSTLLGTPTYATYTLNENTNGSATTVVIPAKTDASPLYLCIGTQSALTTDIVYIDKIEVWGTVSVILTPSLSTDIASKIIKASKSHSVSFPVNLSGVNLTADAAISLTGTNPTNFSIDKTSITAATLNASSPQTITVTYPANTIGSHSATLHIESTGATSLDIPITATCDLFSEDFAGYDATVNTATTLAALIPMANNVSSSRVTGWTGNYLYQFKAGGTNLATVCLGSTATDSAYITTPAIDLSQPFTLTFKARSLGNLTDGKFNVYLDGTQLIYSGTNPTWTFADYTTQAFVGTATSKLTFTGRKALGNEIVIDGIVVNNSLNPALNVALNKVVDFGPVTQGSEKTVNIPVQGYNLAGDLNISLKNGANFTLTSPATIAQATASSTTNIDVKFIAPISTTEIVDTLIISSTGLTDRKIAIKATPTIATTLDLDNKTNEKIISCDNGVELIGYVGKKITVYNLTGLKIREISNAGNNEKLFFTNAGCYLLNIEGKTHSQVRKVIIK